MFPEPSRIRNETARAVRHFWTTRLHQQHKQKTSKRPDYGERSAVTGGAQMDGFVSMFRDMIVEAGIPETDVYSRSKVVLPGFFRPTKEWDLLVVHGGHVVAALEMKSHVGPSFGNNFNNRTEEAMGSALDLWTAYRDGAFGNSEKPWLGYLVLLEDCPKVRTPVAVQEPHYPVFEPFKEASYLKRYSEFCKRLVRERQYDSAALIVSEKSQGPHGIFEEPESDLGMERFCRAIIARSIQYADGK
jgi:hypothetical protein